MEVIEINKELIPYTFEMVLNREVFEFRVDYNNTADLFTVSLYKDGQPLCIGEPIIYGIPIFSDIQNRGHFPKVTITPIDPSDETQEVTFDNLSATVLLVLEGDVDVNTEN